MNIQSYIQMKYGTKADFQSMINGMLKQKYCDVF